MGAGSLDCNLDIPVPCTYLYTMRRPIMIRPHSALTRESMCTAACCPAAPGRLDRIARAM